MSRKPVDGEDSSEVSSSDDGSGSGSGSDTSGSGSDGSSDESSDDDEGPVHKPIVAAKVVSNKAHDEEFNVDNSEKVPTPREEGGGPPPAASSGGGGGDAAKLEESGSIKITNDRHDEEFAVDGSSGNQSGAAPPQDATPAPVQRKTSNVKPTIAGAGGQMKNDPNDEAFDVEDDMSSESEDEDNSPPQRTTGPTGSQVLKNRPDDEAFDVDSPERGGGGGGGGAGSVTRPPAATQKAPAAQPGDDESGEDEAPSSDVTTDEDSEEDEESVPRMGPGNVALPTAATSGANNASLEYNPEDYAFLNAKVSREVRDLFSHITEYQATTMECPAKLRPFIPEFIPCVGDIDTFCKVPRPDEKPDNFGLTVVDEPSCDQSNPFVVKIALSHQISKVPGLAGDNNVAMVDDAQNRPQLIDKWITDIKHVSKQLPTVTYTKPMPQIESLMQIWPKDFEDMLNSDVAFPGSAIDLDIDQYVRVLCTLLDIPTYANLVESLHVMFTLFLEFRANQHFQHA